MMARSLKAPPGVALGRCVCGVVEVEIGVPARWAWHDHSEASRHAQGCAYTTYVGSWRSRFRIVEGEDHVTRFEDDEAGTARIGFDAASCNGAKGGVKWDGWGECWGRLAFDWETFSACPVL